MTQLFVGSLLYPLFKLFWPDESEERASELAWRTVCIVPAAMALATGIIVYFISDDAPKGNYRDLQKKKNGDDVVAKVNAGAAFRKGACDINSWLLFVQYACSFGVELTVKSLFES